MRPNLARVTALVVGALALAAAACSPTFAPPVRSPHAGAPGGLRPDQRLEVGGAVQVPHGGATGGPHVAVRLTDRVAIEVGADLATNDGDDVAWGMGWLGLRGTLGDWRDADLAGFVIDGEVGLGLGVGGVHHVGSGESAVRDDIDTWERLAGGGYVGSSQGWHANDVFAVFLSERVQLTIADAVPPTFWWSTTLGIELTLRPVSLWLAGGVAGFANADDGGLGPLGMTGLSLRF